MIIVRKKIFFRVAQMWFDTKCQNKLDIIYGSDFEVDVCR